MSLFLALAILTWILYLLECLFSFSKAYLQIFAIECLFNFSYTGFPGEFCYGVSLAFTRLTCIYVRFFVFKKKANYLKVNELPTSRLQMTPPSPSSPMREKAPSLSPDGDVRIPQSLYIRGGNQINLKDKRVCVGSEQKTILLAPTESTANYCR